MGNTDMNGQDVGVGDKTRLSGFEQAIQQQHTEAWQTTASQVCPPNATVTLLMASAAASSVTGVAALLSHFFESPILASSSAVAWVKKTNPAESLWWMTGHRGLS